MRPSWFTAATLASTVLAEPANLACQAQEVYQHAATCPFSSSLLSVRFDSLAAETPSPHRQPTKESSQQWSKSPPCHHPSGANTSEPFCAFTNPTFDAGSGIAIITTESNLRLLIAQPPFSSNTTTPQNQKQAQQKQAQKLYTPVSIPGKGIGLVAATPIRQGTKIMAVLPALLIDGRAWGGLAKRELGGLISRAVGGLGGKMREGFAALSGLPDPGWEGRWEGGVVAGNAFRVEVKGGVGGGGGDGHRDGGVFQGVFVEVSRLNHDCAPNLGYYFDAASAELRVYAVRDIFSGEELTISYIDVTEKHSTRQERLSSTWSFTCTCPRCMLEPHLLAESDSRVRQMRELSRELDDYSSAATPGQAELLVTLYELEGLHVRIYEAYYRAALEWNGAGDAARAVRYARLCLDKGLVLRGEDRPFVMSMREMVRDPKGHWSWRFRVKPQGDEEGAAE